MIDIARRMRWDPDQLTDADTIRAAAQPRRPDHAAGQPTAQPAQQPAGATARTAAAGLSPVGS